MSAIKDRGLDNTKMALKYLNNIKQKNFDDVYNLAVAFEVSSLEAVMFALKSKYTSSRDVATVARAYEDFGKTLALKFLNENFDSGFSYYKAIKNYKDNRRHSIKSGSRILKYNKV